MMEADERDTGAGGGGGDADSGDDGRVSGGGEGTGERARRWWQWGRVQRDAGETMMTDEATGERWQQQRWSRRVGGGDGGRGGSGGGGDRAGR